MAAVIKHRDPHGAIVRALDAVRSIAPVAEPVTDPRVAECERLRGEVQRLERRIATLSAESEIAIEAAGLAGHAAGLAAAESRETERVAELAASLSVQAAALESRLDALDGLAAALARTALARVFDRSETMADMVVATITRNIDMLRAHAALRIAVSAADFSSYDRIAALAGGSIAVEIQDGLASGACRVSCRLGEVDLEIPGQWARLADALDQMAGAA